MWPIATDAVAWPVSLSVRDKRAMHDTKVAATIIIVLDTDSRGPKWPCIR